IRSATYSLGVLQAIAELPSPGAGAGEPKGEGAEFGASLLSRFDYLSTVSGGGYVGAFLSSLFVPGRLDRQPDKPAPPIHPAGAADQAARVLKSGPPGRIRATERFRDDRGRLKP